MEPSAEVMKEELVRNMASLSHEQFSDYIGKLLDGIFPIVHAVTENIDYCPAEVVDAVSNFSEIVMRGR